MSTPLIKRLSTAEADFLPTLDRLTAWNSVSDVAIENSGGQDYSAGSHQG